MSVEAYVKANMATVEWSDDAYFWWLGQQQLMYPGRWLFVWNELGDQRHWNPPTESLLWYNRRQSALRTFWLREHKRRQRLEDAVRELMEDE